MKEFLFILLYLYVAGFIIFGFNAMARFHIAIANGIKNLFNYTNNNSSKVRDFVVIIACICVVIASIVAVIVVAK